MALGKVIRLLGSSTAAVADTQQATVMCAGALAIAGLPFWAPGETILDQFHEPRVDRHKAFVVTFIALGLGASDTEPAPLEVHV